MQRIRLLRWMISINIINVLVVMLILTTACITIRPAAATAWPFHPPSSTVRHTGIAEASSSSHPWLVIIEAIMDPVPWILLQGIPAKWLALISLLPPFINRYSLACCSFYQTMSYENIFIAGFEQHVFGCSHSNYDSISATITGHFTIHYSRRPDSTRNWRRNSGRTTTATTFCVGVDSSCRCRRRCCRVAEPTTTDQRRVSPTFFFSHF